MELTQLNKRLRSFKGSKICIFHFSLSLCCQVLMQVWEWNKRFILGTKNSTRYTVRYRAKNSPVNVNLLNYSFPNFLWTDPSLLYIFFPTGLNGAFKIVAKLKARVVVFSFHQCTCPLSFQSHEMANKRIVCNWTDQANFIWDVK